MLLPFIQKVPSQTSVPPRVSTAIDGLSGALQRVADSNTSILYGNCYVMFTDKKGIKWQHQAKPLAEIELSQRAKLVANQLDEKLFEKVSF